tara:strand:- start:8738 stop:9022 length:285 start_codon:yes stop_codon:yes gene_type:complete
VGAVRDPLNTAYGHNFDTVLQIGCGLLGVHPIGIKKEPSRSDRRQVYNQRMQDITIPWGVGNEEVYIILHVYYIKYIFLISAKSMLTMDVAPFF